MAKDCGVGLYSDIPAYNNGVISEKNIAIIGGCFYISDPEIDKLIADFATKYGATSERSVL